MNGNKEAKRSPNSLSHTVAADFTAGHAAVAAEHILQIGSADISAKTAYKERHGCCYEARLDPRLVG